MPLNGHATAPSTARTLNCDHGRRRHLIVQSLLRDIFQGRLRAGQHLVTQTLADQYQVSHTPVREALIALSGIGIVDLVPNRGAIVRHVTARDVEEISQVRRVLECEAVRLACGRADEAALQDIAARLKRLMHVSPPIKQRFITQSREVDSRLHDLIAASCGNKFLANELGRLKILFRAFRDVAWEHHVLRSDYRRLAEEAGEHLAIVEALLRGDAREAARQMSRHIRHGTKYWGRALE